MIHYNLIDVALWTCLFHVVSREQKFEKIVICAVILFFRDTG